MAPAERSDDSCQGFVNLVVCAEVMSCDGFVLQCCLCCRLADSGLVRRGMYQPRRCLLSLLLATKQSEGGGKWRDDNAPMEGNYANDDESPPPANVSKRKKDMYTETHHSMLEAVAGIPGRRRKLKKRTGGDFSEQNSLLSLAAVLRGARSAKDI